MYCFFLLFGLFCLLVCLNVLEEAGKLPVASWIYSRVGWNIPVFGGAGSVFVTGTILFSHKLPLSWNPLGGEGIIFRGKTKGMSHLVLASKQWPWLSSSLCPLLLVLHTGLDFTSPAHCRAHSAVGQGEETGRFLPAQAAGQRWLEWITDLRCPCFSSLVTSFAAVTGQVFRLWKQHRPQR